MKRWLTGFVAAVGLLVAGDPVHAQSRADSAAVLLHAIEQLRLRGEAAAARALLDYVERQYAGTVAAADVARLRAAMRRVPEADGPGRTELIVWSTGYGAWLGVAVPLMLGSESPEAYGVGFLAGAPLGFLAARTYASRRHPSEGQARAITFVGSWGTWQGLGWAEVLGVGTRTRHVDCPPDIPECVSWEYEETDTEALVAAAVVGGLLGAGSGIYLARKPITAGTAAAVSLSALWGTWFSFAGSWIAGLDDDALLAGTLVGGNVFLLASALAAPRWQMTESRARLISLGGLIGGLAGVGLLLIVQPDDEKVGVAIPMVASAAGLALGATTTRDRAPAEDRPPGGGALLRGDGRRWALDVPQPSLRIRREQARLQPAIYVPVVEARF